MYLEIKITFDVKSKQANAFDIETSKENLFFFFSI